MSKLTPEQHEELISEIWQICPAGITATIPHLTKKAIDKAIFHISPDHLFIGISKKPDGSHTVYVSTNIFLIIYTEFYRDRNNIHAFVCE